MKKVYIKKIIFLAVLFACYSATQACPDLNKNLTSNMYKHFKTVIFKLSQKGITPHIFEIPVPYTKIIDSDLILSYPMIPSKNCSPWEAPATANLLTHTHKEKPIFHLRTRDFESISSVIRYLKPHLGHVRILLVYGDGHNAGSQLTPCDLITPLKKMGFEVGVVVNPTPVFRTIEQEKQSFIQKLALKPDFVITQCFYDADEAKDFFQEVALRQEIPCTTKIYINLGFWRKGAPLQKLGIKNNGQFEPSEQLLAFAKSEFFSGVCVCNFIPET